MLFNHDRQKIRQFYFDSWSKYQNNQPLEPVEMMIAEVIKQHPEYHILLDSEVENQDQDYFPEAGESNPFLHMGMHIAIMEQLSTQRPKEIVEIHQSLSKSLGDCHQAEHQIMECLAEMLWQSQRQGEAPDEKTYIENLTQLVKRRKTP